MTDHTVAGIAAAPRPEASSTFSQIAVLAALSATGTLATNILLPSLPQMAASLHVSTAEVTAAITVFLAVFAIGQLAVETWSETAICGSDGSRILVASVPVAASAASTAISEKVEDACGRGAAAMAATVSSVMQAPGRYEMTHII